MAGDNFQDNVELRSDTILHAKGNAVMVGTDPGAKSFIVSNDIAEGHLVWNPTVNRTITIPDMGGTLILSGQAVQGLGVSTGGNTLGDTGTTVGTVVLEGLGAVTLSQITAAGSLATVRISVPAGANNNAIGVSTGGNTAGTTGTTQGTYVLAGGGAITLSQSTAAGSLATVTISAPQLAIAAGSQTATSGTVVLSNSGNVTFGMSNSSVVTATVENRQSHFVWPPGPAQTNFTISNATFSLQKITIAAHLTATRLQLLMDLTANTNSTGALTISVGFYTLSGSTASLATSGSRNLTWTSGSATSASSVVGGVSGTRYRTLGINLTVTPGDYLVGVHLRTTNNGTWRIFGVQAASIVGAVDANETNYFLDGTSVSSFTTAMPASINVTDTNYARTGAAALRQPSMILIGTF